MRHGGLDRAGRRARHAAPLDHRRPRQPSAGRQRGRRDPCGLQWRDLQLRELRATLEAQGPSFRDERGLGDDRAPLRGVRHRLRRAICAACSGSPFGTAVVAGSCSRATAWASSRSTTRRRRLGSRSARRSRRSSPGGLVSPHSTPWPQSSSWPTASCPAPAPCSRECASFRRRRCSCGTTAAFRRAASTGRPGTATRRPPDVGRKTRRLSSICSVRPSTRGWSRDVPLGVMLSGGLDSSLIATLMAEHSTRPVQTFSIGFAEDGDANELTDARCVAEQIGADHHEITTSAADHPGLLDEALWHLEEPIADVSCLGFLLLSRLAGEDVTVALSGQGADELLGGYRKHEIASLAAAARGAPRPLRRLGQRTGPPRPQRLDVRARDGRSHDRRSGRPAAGDEPCPAGARARGAPPGAVPPARSRRGDCRRRSGAHGAGFAQPARRDTAPRHTPSPRGQHAPLLRQDVDGSLARGPSAVHGSRRGGVLLAPAGHAPRLAPPPEGAPPPRKPRVSSTTPSSTSRSEDSSTPPSTPGSRSTRRGWSTRRCATAVRSPAGSTTRCAHALDRRPQKQEGQPDPPSVLLLERWQRIFVDGDASFSGTAASPQGDPVGLLVA